MRIGALGLAAAGLVISVFGQGAIAGTIRHDVNDQNYLGLANDPRYSSVGRFGWLEGQDRYSASGTLITSSGDLWVLTAAHVVDTAGPRTFYIGGESFASQLTVAHPSWDGELSKGYDIGLVKLDVGSGALPEGITAAQRYTESSEVGKVGTFVGYGYTGTGITGASEETLEKRAGQNMIDVLFRTPGKTSRMFGVDFDSPSMDTNVLGSSAPLSLEYLIGFGDSGGGVFIDVGGSTLLAGVHSFGVDYDRDGNWADYGDYTGHTRVSQFNSWIDSVIGGGGGEGGGGKGKGGKPFEANVSGVVPEPASASLLAVGGVLGLRRRRGR